MSTSVLYQEDLLQNFSFSIGQVVRWWAPVAVPYRSPKILTVIALLQARVPLMLSEVFLALGGRAGLFASIFLHLGREFVDQSRPSLSFYLPHLPHEDIPWLQAVHLEERRGRPIWKVGVCQTKVPRYNFGW